MFCLPAPVQSVLGAKHISNPDFGAILKKETDVIIYSLLANMGDLVSSEVQELEIIGRVVVER